MPKRELTASQAREREVTKAVKDYLTARGWRAVRFQRTVIPGSFQTGEPGIPDTLFLYYKAPPVALALWVEFKRATRGKRSEDQKQWHAREQQRGALVVTVNDPAEFAAWYERTFPELVGQLRLGA